MSIPLNIDWQQILLHLFNFAILVLGLYILIYKPVKNFMDKRTAHYEEMDRKAKEGVAQAEEMKADYAEQLKTVDAEISRRRAEADAQTARVTKARIDEAEAQAAQVLAEAKQDAELERQKILSSANRQIIELASVAAEKMVKESLEAAQAAGDDAADAAEEARQQELTDTRREIVELASAAAEKLVKESFDAQDSEEE